MLLELAQLRIDLDNSPTQNIDQLLASVKEIGIVNPEAFSVHGQTVMHGRYLATAAMMCGYTHFNTTTHQFQKGTSDFCKVSYFKELKRGDIVRNAGSGQTYVVDANYGTFVVVVDTKAIMNLSEWEKMK